MSLHDHYKRLLEKFQDSFSGVNKKLQSFLKIGVESSLRIRRRQFLMGGCLALGISVFVYAVMNVLRSQGPVPKQETPTKPVPTNITTATKQVDMSEVRWNNLDGAINTLRQQLAEIAEAVYGDANKFKTKPAQTDSLQAVDEAQQNQQLSEQENTPNETEANDPSSNPELQTSLKEIRERLSVLETERDTQPPFMGQSASYHPPQNGDEQNAGSIQKLSVNLVDSPKNLKNVETTIPAGAFAKTVLLSGLDASRP